MDIVLLHKNTLGDMVPWRVSISRQHNGSSVPPAWCLVLCLVISEHGNGTTVHVEFWVRVCTGQFSGADKKARISLKLLHSGLFVFAAIVNLIDVGIQLVRHLLPI